MYFHSQDPQLSKIVRSLPGVPLLYVAHKAINLEKPQMSHEKVAESTPEDEELLRLREMKRVILGEEETVVKKKRKKVKGANPLSCLKKKAKSQSEVVPSEGKKRRARKRRKRNVNASSAPSSQPAQTSSES